MSLTVPRPDESDCLVDGLVTVCIPTYLQESYVTKALDSVLEQAYPNYEIIVIDDASPADDSGAVRRWAAEHPTVPLLHLVNETNLGVTRTINLGLLRARGEYFTLLAGDDELTRVGLHARVAYLDRHQHYSAVFGDCHVIDEVGAVTHASGLEDLRPWLRLKKRDLRIPQLIPSLLTFRWAVPGPVFMARTRDLVALGGYSEDLSIEDWDLYMRLCSADRIGFVDEVVARYRISDASVLSRAKRSGEELSMHSEASLQRIIDSSSGVRRMYFLGMYYGSYHGRSPRRGLALPCRLLGKGLRELAKGLHRLSLLAGRRQHWTARGPFKAPQVRNPPSTKL